MSDILPRQAGPVDMRFGLLRTMPNYRQAIAAMIPAMYMVYAIVIWPLLYAGQYSTVGITEGAPSTPVPSILSTLVFPALFGLAALLFLAERSRLPRLRTLPLLVLLVFWAYLALSTTWSLSPNTSLKDFIVLTLSLLGLGMSVMLVDSIERLLRPMFWVLAIAMLINLASVLLTPPGPIGHEGIYIHKNDLGGIAAVGVLFAVYGLTIRATLYRLVSIVAIAAWLLILLKSESKTSLGLVLVTPVLSFAVIFARRYLRIALPVLLAIAAAIIIAVVSGAFPSFNQGDLSALIGSDRTFTGRVEIWDFIIQQLSGRELTGFGFHSFWSYEAGDSSPTMRSASNFMRLTPTAHNGYLELMLWGGWIALAMFAVIMVLLGDWISRITDQDQTIGYLLTSMIVFIGLHNLLESNWFSDNSIHAILINVMLMAMIAGRPARPPQHLVQLL